MKTSPLARVAPALILGSVLLGGVAVPVHAQNASPDATAPAATAAPHRSTTASRGHSSAASGQSMQAMVESRITELHNRLHITKEQEPQWQQFTQVMRDNAKGIDAAYQQRAAKLQTMSAVDNMQSYAEIEQTRAQDVQKLVPAFQTLYASLSDQQKKSADQLFRARAEAARERRAGTK